MASQKEDDKPIDQRLVGLPHINDDDAWLAEHEATHPPIEPTPYDPTVVSAPLRVVAVRSSGHVLVVDDRDPTRGRVLNPDGTWSRNIKTIDAWVSSGGLAGYWEPCDEPFTDITDWV